MLATSFLSRDDQWVRLMARPASFDRWILTETINGCLLTILGTYNDMSEVLTAATSRRAELS